MKCDVFVCGEISVCPLVRSLFIRATRRFQAIERDDELRRADDVAHGPAPRRGSTSRGRVQVAPVRAAASSAVPALATKTNPLENINLLDVAGNPATPWNTDKTVVVSFLRNFG